MDMRSHLRSTFDRIYVLDLHGNSKKKETTPDGKPDKNVFDIQQGVAIIIGVKRRRTDKNKPPAEIIHGDLWGSRAKKYAALTAETWQSLDTSDVSPPSSPWRFVPFDYVAEERYRRGFSLADLYNQSGTPAPGIVTTQDEFAISWTSEDASKKVRILLASESETEARKHFRLCSQNQWNYDEAKRALSTTDWQRQITPIHYRPFDNRVTVYNSHVAVHRRTRATSHLVGRENLAVAVPRQTRDEVGALVLRYPSTHKIFAAYDINFILPLYLYPDETADQADALAPTERMLNLDPKLYAKICKAAGIDPADMAGPEDDFRAPTGDARPSEVKVFDYIYSVLHSPDYRETFAEFLKIDFPRIPYPASAEVFKHVSEKGEALRRLHLMEDAAIGEANYPFLTEEGAVPEEANNEVAPAHPKFVPTPNPSRKREGGDDGALPAGRVYINKHQYFDGVPQVAWDFYIGGYQPAQKWLKDRKGRSLDYNDVGHYQKIVKILIETDRIMREIELPLDLGD